MTDMGLHGTRIYRTQYGEVTGDGQEEFYPSGRLKSVRTVRESVLDTPYGSLTPVFRTGDIRRKYRYTVTFWENGNLKSIYLEFPVSVQTRCGETEAELLTFYESGRICRIFPLYGQLSGCWTEEDEYGLANAAVFRYGPDGQEVTCRPRVLKLYESGNLQSLTIWRQMPVEVRTPCGPVRTRVGFELYESGAVRAVEPDFSVSIQTGYGILYPYDPERFSAMHADGSSLRFLEDGRIASLHTIRNRIILIYPDGREDCFVPPEEPDPFYPDAVQIRPIEVILNPERALRLPGGTIPVGDDVKMRAEIWKPRRTEHR